ncbi:hypothetical protein BH23CHL5_BH23CHL5_17580 [soil metagenome]
MLNRLLLPIDGSGASMQALPYAEVIPSQIVRMIMVIPGDLSPKDRIQAAADAEAQLREASGVFEQQGRAVELLVLDGEPAEEILVQSEDADLTIMTTRGYGPGRRFVYGSVADDVARRSATPVLLVRGGERPIPVVPVSRIVVPLDGSEAAERSLRLATDLATTIGVPVMLIRVVDIEGIQEAAHLAATLTSGHAATVDALRHAASTYLAEKAQVFRDASLPAAIDVRIGEPVPEIKALVEEGDVLVMSSHGRTGVKRLLIGSVTAELVQSAMVPVLIVHAPDAPAS